MTFLGFRIERDLKEELERNDENEVINVESVSEFIEKIKEKRYDCIFVEEKNLPVETLINLIKKIEEFQKKSVILVLGQSADIKVVAGSIKAGAYDYILKPAETMDIIKIAEKAVKNHKLMAERVEKTKNLGDKLIGQTKEIIEVYKKIGQMASSRMPVLVMGQKGTGKTSVALAIHQFGDSSKKPFISINCMSFPQQLLERRLFGYEKGAFEGAVFFAGRGTRKSQWGNTSFGEYRST